MPSPTTVKLVISSQVNLIDLVHAAAEKVAEVAGFDSDEALNVGLAMREAVINAMVHGNQQDPDKMVDVTLTAEGSMLTARVRDYGPGFDPEAKPDPTEDDNLLMTSGRGILMIRAFVDDVEFERKDVGMELKMTKRLNDSSAKGKLMPTASEGVSA